MIDCGATAIGFIDSDFAQAKSLTLVPLHSPKRIRVVDGRTSLAGPVTHYVSLDLSVSEHTEKSVRFYVTQLGQYNLILGKPWLAEHNPLVRLVNIDIHAQKFNLDGYPNSEFNLDGYRYNQDDIHIAI
jgi:hypothetical protein